MSLSFFDTAEWRLIWIFAVVCSRNRSRTRINDKQFYDKQPKWQRQSGWRWQPGPLVLGIYFVEIAARFESDFFDDDGNRITENVASGLVFVGGNGITQHVGDNLPGFLGGREVVASVVAREIGHNLGLNHIIEGENLMLAGASANPVERLNAAQIATARNSAFVSAVVVPEPSSLITMLGITTVTVIRRRNAKRS